MGARESNAGDDFHFWWAAYRALTLVAPGAELRLLTLEGLARVDDPDEAYETVDVAEYFGGNDVATARALVLSQLKYSTRHPDRAWTAARLCEQRRRRPATGSAGRARSVIADLATAYRRLLDDHGRAAAAKVKVALVTNQPADQLLLASISAAASWIRAQARPVQRTALLCALPAEQAAVIYLLSAAIGSRLTGSAFCDFLSVLDLSQTGAMDRVPLARAVRRGASELTPGRGPDSAWRLFQLVRDQAMPGRHDGLTAADVLVALGAPDLVDLYPAPPRLPDVPNPLPTPNARALADACLGHLGRLIVARGPAGAGKTTALMQVQDHLPAGSALVLFDCYGGGEYLSTGEERHIPRRFVTQVTNELAQCCGTSLLVRPPQDPDDLWRWFRRTLERAADALDPGAVLVLAVDAADNAVVAAAERGERGFVADLVRLRLPDRVALVLTARSHRVPSLGADPAAAVELTSFDAATSAAHLCRYRPGASDEDAAVFHDRTGGNPRAQFYALEQAAANGADMPGVLESCAHLEPIFDGLVKSALEVSGADAGGRRWLALMLALSRPLSIGAFAAALDVDQSAVAAFAAGLEPGVKVADGAIQFRDEDFETYVRDRVEGADVVAAHDRLATCSSARGLLIADAAAHVADHLSAAGRLDEVLQLVARGGLPGRHRGRVQARAGAGPAAGPGGLRSCSEWRRGCGRARGRQRLRHGVATRHTLPAGRLPARPRRPLCRYRPAPIARAPAGPQPVARAYTDAARRRSVARPGQARRRACGTRSRRRLAAPVDGGARGRGPALETRAGRCGCGCRGALPARRPRRAPSRNCTGGARPSSCSTRSRPLPCASPPMSPQMRRAMRCALTASRSPCRRPFWPTSRFSAAAPDAAWVNAVARSVAGRAAWPAAPLAGRDARCGRASRRPAGGDRARDDIGRASSHLANGPSPEQAMTAPRSFDAMPLRQPSREPTCRSTRCPGVAAAAEDRGRPRP